MRVAVMSVMYNYGAFTLNEKARGLNELLLTFLLRQPHNMLVSCISQPII